MAHAKYIKRGSKTFGPYYYKSVREKDGRVTKVYLGTELKKEKKYSLWLVLAIVLFIALIIESFAGLTDKIVAGGQEFVPNSIPSYVMGI